MISGDIYEEVYEILSYMDKVTVMKIPENILHTIINRRNINFKTKIDKNNIFDEKNVSKETVDFICWLDYNFLMSDERRKEIDRIRIEKNNKIELEKKLKYNPDIFNTKEDKRVVQQKQETVQMEEYKENIFKGILNKIKRFFLR